MRNVHSTAIAGIGSLFKAFEERAASDSPLPILDYSLSQSTLEQVFISFAKQQVDNEH
jgi:hypothetical protein